MIEMQPPTGLIILNQPLVLFIPQLLEASSKVVCADGGANHLRKFNPHIKPHVIVGDFDSLDEETRAFYTSKKVTFVHDFNQNFTDFQKSLLHCADMNSVCVSGALTGRFDHILACLHALYDAPMPVYLFSDASVCWLLKPGTHHITRSPTFGTSCGLCPLDGPAIVHTCGLKWEVDGTMKFGTFISTSNEMKPDAVNVAIKTDRNLLWTIEMRV